MDYILEAEENAIKNNFEEEKDRDLELLEEKTKALDLTDFVMRINEKELR